MGKKSRSTQELANGFPEWAKTRFDEQSVGQSFLNVIGQNLETIDTELYRGYKNLALTTANVAEIDQTYRYLLPASFEFDVDDPNQLTPLPLAPTVSGKMDDTWYAISEAETGTIEEFWYDAIPDRIELVATEAGAGYSLLSVQSSGLVWEGIPEIFEPNNLWVTVESGVQLFEAASNTDDFTRSTVRITGTTWKDSEEIEELGFLYNQTQRSIKVWKEITKIEALSFPSQATIHVNSHGFLQENIEDTFELTSQFTHGRDNMPHFWNIQESCWVPGLFLLGNNKYVVDRALDVLRNRTEVGVHREWELVDSELNTITPVDIAPIPFTQRAWVVNASGLYLYDLEWDQPDTSVLVGRTQSPLAQIEADKIYVTRDEVVEVQLRFIRPIQTVIRHRLSIKYPDGVTMGVLADGTLVSESSDYWVDSIQEERQLRHPTDFQFDDAGDHLLTLEVLYQGNETQIDKRIIRVCRKEPLAEFDLYSVIGVEAKAIDVDHQQRLLVLDTNDDAHEILPRYDTMLIDYGRKEVVFREPYTEVKVIKQ